jgi:hypothetical protein
MSFVRKVFVLKEITEKEINTRVRDKVSQECHRGELSA